MFVFSCVSQSSKINKVLSSCVLLIIFSNHFPGNCLFPLLFVFKLLCNETLGYDLRQGKIIK